MTVKQTRLVQRFVHRGGAPTRRQRDLLLEIHAYDGKLGIQSILDDFSRRTMYLVESAGWTTYTDNASDVMGAYLLTAAGRAQLGAG